MKSSANMNFDIRDLYGGNKPNCSVYSLKLTDPAFTELQAAIKTRRIQIKFENENNGKIRFDASKPWDQAGRSFQFSKNTENTVIFEHESGEDHVLNYGEITKSFKINPTVTDSFKKMNKDMMELQKSKENTATKEIENKFSRSAPKYALKRKEALKGKAAPTRSSPDSTSITRTPTPPPTQFVDKQLGNVETRVLHILATNNNKLTSEKLKQFLHQRQLILGPEMGKIAGILDKVAVMKNNKCWSVKKESLSLIKPDWAGYNMKERQLAKDFLNSDFEQIQNIATKRKSDMMDDRIDPTSRTVTNRSTTPIVEDVERKRQRLMPNQPKRMLKSPLDNSSRDSSHSNIAHFTPVESPAMSLSSNGGGDQSPALSEASQTTESPSSPKQKSTSSVSPVSKPASAAPKLTAMQLKYEKIKQNISQKKEQQKSEERARKVSNEEVSENAKKYGIDEAAIESLRSKYKKEYPEIESESEVVRYKKLLKHEMDTYDSLRKSKHVHTYEKFTKHEKEMRKLEMGSAEYLKMYRKVLDDYRIECGRGYLKYKRELIECKTRHTHLKERLEEYYAEMS